MYGLDEIAKGKIVTWVVSMHSLVLDILWGLNKCLTSRFTVKLRLWAPSLAWTGYSEALSLNFNLPFCIF